MHEKHDRTFDIPTSVNSTLKTIQTGFDCCVGCQLIQLMWWAGRMMINHHTLQFIFSFIPGSFLHTVVMQGKQQMCLEIAQKDLAPVVATVLLKCSLQCSNWALFWVFFSFDQLLSHCLADSSSYLFISVLMTSWSSMNSECCLAEERSYLGGYIP